MGLELSKVHDYQKVPGSMEVRLVKTRPYVRLCREGGPPLYVQEGRIYSEGGPEMDPVPAWFWEEAGRVAPAVRDETGLASLLAQHTTGTTAPPESVSLSPLWICPDCSHEVERRVKGLHIARHRRRVTPAGKV